MTGARRSAVCRKLVAQMLTRSASERSARHGPYHWPTQEKQPLIGDHCARGYNHGGRPTRRRQRHPAQPFPFSRDRSGLAQASARDGPGRTMERRAKPHRDEDEPSRCGHHRLLGTEAHADVVPLLSDTRNIGQPTVRARDHGGRPDPRTPAQLVRMARDDLGQSPNQQMQPMPIASCDRTTFELPRLLQSSDVKACPTKN
ncbi:hypothetical protein PR202_gb21509 [Eleusine coracana subsp. coracana]|uniref:Uncharacterized protein n=1 Tax=Eleusine coracana subsp. coracana TaxID=191504 RepID=A0AAV5FDE7_ELECO|nr:hypothetical protein PR202_gb21509 [Eleusine coracana subsp. coracana]